MTELKEDYINMEIPKEPISRMVFLEPSITELGKGIKRFFNIKEE